MFPDESRADPFVDFLPRHKKSEHACMSTTPASIAPQSPAVSAAFKDVPIVAASRYQPLVLVLVAVSMGMVADRLALPMVPHSFQMWWALATLAFVAWLTCWR